MRQEVLELLSEVESALLRRDPRRARKLLAQIQIRELSEEEQEIYWRLYDRMDELEYELLEEWAQIEEWMEEFGST